jgi:hypothetical protein
LHFPDYIPQADIKFLEWATILIHNLGKSIERFDFPEELHAQLKQLLDNFTRKFDLAITPATRTATAVLAKNNARDEEKGRINANPPGVHGIEIVWAILDAPPSTHAALVHSALATRVPIRLARRRQALLLLRPVGEHPQRERPLERNTERHHPVMWTLWL